MIGTTLFRVNRIYLLVKFVFYYFRLEAVFLILGSLYADNAGVIVNPKGEMKGNHR